MDYKKKVTTDFIENTLKKGVRDMPQNPGAQGYTARQIRGFYYIPEREILIAISNIEDDFIKLLEELKKNTGDGGGETPDLSDYQKKTDETLETESKEVVGAINELNSGKVPIPSELGNKYTDNIVILSSDNKYLFLAVDQGNGITRIGKGLAISAASTSEIEEKKSNYKPITPLYLDEAIRIGITTNTKTLTNEEKAKAQAWLGISSGGKLYKHNVEIVCGSTDLPNGGLGVFRYTFTSSDSRPLDQIIGENEDGENLEYTHINEPAMFSYMSDVATEGDDMVDSIPVFITKISQLIAMSASELHFMYKEKNYMTHSAYMITDTVTEA